MSEFTRMGVSVLQEVFWQRVVMPMYIYHRYPSHEVDCRGLSVQRAHEDAIKMMAWLDKRLWVTAVLAMMQETALPKELTSIGGVDSDYAMWLAAGWVKGLGFATNEEAMEAVNSQVNIIPGYRSMPQILNHPVMFGSYTPDTRVGNAPEEGVVVWRYQDGSLQNRVGLTNPGAEAAAEFMAINRERMPKVFGVNIAVSPGVESVEQQVREVVAAFQAFIGRGIYPSVFELNLSCPNTEDDPRGNQTTELIEVLVGGVVRYLQSVVGQTKSEIPLWVKIGPDLEKDQYKLILSELEELGVKGITATNTVPVPTPDKSGRMAGMSGRFLHKRAVEVCHILMEEKREKGYGIDIVGVGGILTPADLKRFKDVGIKAWQYASALVFGGPFVASAIVNGVARVSK